MFDLIIYNSYKELMTDEPATPLHMNGICMDYVIQLLPLYAKCGFAVVVLPHEEKQTNG